MSVTLEQILNEVDIDATETIHIEYRTNSPYPEDEEDIFCGMCSYKDGKIYSEDGDTYDLTDEFFAYEWIDFNHLTVWYKSAWITSDQRHCTCNEGECSCNDNCECEVW